MVTHKFISWIKVGLDDEKPCLINPSVATQYFKLEMGAHE